MIADAWVWHYTNSGLYIVSSGYRLAESLRPTLSSKLGPCLMDSRLWASLWGSLIQPKLKFFVWKVFHNILPLQETLADRTIVAPTFCSVCHGPLETLPHLFAGCTVARS
ncbi:hypothetical protein LINGRAHAP2_LOCUS15249 [Linum grandiflorum]